MKTAATASERALLQSILGKVAIANAKLAYQRYKELFRGPRWDALAKKGAQTQRLLWASTSTKNKAYSDVMYVEGLAAPDTIDSIPPETLAAFRDHGKARIAIDPNDKEPGDIVGRLIELEIRQCFSAFSRIRATAPPTRTSTTPGRA